MERRIFILFLAISLGAHVALLLLCRGMTGSREGAVRPLAIYLRPGAGPAPAALPDSPAPSAPRRGEAAPKASPSDSPRVASVLSRPLPVSALKPADRPALPPGKTGEVRGEVTPPAEGGPGVTGNASSSSSGTGSDTSLARIGGGGDTFGGPEGSTAGSGKAGASPELVKAEPAYERNPPPRYPRPALDRGWEGTVLLQVRVTPLGEVAELKIERTSGHAVLDRAATEAVRNWRFRPARLGERAIEGTVLVPVAFTLRRS